MTIGALDTGNILNPRDLLFVRGLWWNVIFNYFCFSVLGDFVGIVAKSHLRTSRPMPGWSAIAAWIAVIKYQYWIMQPQKSFLCCASD